MGNTITLEQQNGEWVEVAPLNGLADIARINSMILNFRNPIPMDVLIETDPELREKLMDWIRPMPLLLRCGS